MSSSLPEQQCAGIRECDAIARRVWLRSPTPLYVINVALLAAVIAWLFFGLTPEPELHDRGLRDLRGLSWSTWCLVAMCVMSCLTFMAMVAGFFFGAISFRRIVSLLTFATLVGCWLAVLSNRSDISWQGKRMRLYAQASSLDAIVDSLTQEWPIQDGELKGLGPFMAYPVGRPKTLILLTPPSLSRKGPKISVVERTDSGALRFELSGTETDDWLEWHPPSSKPTSLTGGLVEHFELERRTKLAGQWHLARYKTFARRDSPQPHPH